MFEPISDDELAKLWAGVRRKHDTLAGAYRAFARLAVGCTAHTNPRAWGWANRRWRVLIAERYPGSEKRAHDSLKKKHDVQSFRDLTVPQVLESVAKLEEMK